MLDAGGACARSGLRRDHAGRPGARALGEAPEEGYGAGKQAADLAGLIEALEIERPAVGGHSMGAGAALRFTADYPDMLRCAILEDPGFRAANAHAPGGRPARDGERPARAAPRRADRPGPPGAPRLG